MKVRLIRRGAALLVAMASATIIIGFSPHVLQTLQIALADPPRHALPVGEWTRLSTHPGGPGPNAETLPRSFELVKWRSGPVRAVRSSSQVSLGRSVASGPSRRPGKQTCPTPAPDTAAGFAGALDALPDDQWLGGDQALSTLLPDGRVLWLWGDTLRKGGFVHNSGILQTRGCFTVLHRGATELIPNRPDGSWYWPSSAVVWGGKLYVFVTHVEATGTPSGFAAIGMDVARFGFASTGDPVFERLLPTPASVAPQGQIHYGAAATQGLDGYTYAYGTRYVSSPSQPVFGKAVYLARVPRGDLADPSAWRYWTQEGWSPDPTKAVELITGRPHGWSSSFSVYLDATGRWVVITKEDEFLGRYLIAATAPNPWGPWTISRLADVASSETHYVYTALAHPEQRLATGKLLVTVCNGGPGAWSDPAHRYRPTFMEIRL